MSSIGFITFLFWLLVAILVSVTHVWELNKEEERTKQLALVATEADINFSSQIEIEALYKSGLALFMQYYDKRIYNAMSVGFGNLGSMVFDYEYYWPGNKMIFRQSVVCFFLAETRLPIFQQGYSNEVIQKLFIRELHNLNKIRPGVSMEMSKEYFICYRKGVRVAPEKILAFWEEGVDLLNLLLDFASKPYVSDVSTFYPKQAE